MAQSAPCVCGCPRSSHQTVPIAVDLPPLDRKPLYIVYGGMGNRSDATRYTDACTCGCMSYLADGPDPEPKKMWVRARQPESWDTAFNLAGHTNGCSPNCCLEGDEHPQFDPK